MQMLEFDEGKRLSIYKDNLGHYTVGVGHLIIKGECSRERAIAILDRKIGCSTGGTIDEQQCYMLFSSDLVDVEESIKRQWYYDIYQGLSDNRRKAVCNIVFQLGAVGYGKFRRHLGALQQGDYKRAYEEGLDSAWAKQTPARCKRVLTVLRDDNFDGYNQFLKRAK